MARYSSDNLSPHALNYIPKFIGNIWYVSTTGNDSNTDANSHTPLTPLRTIGAAISVCSDGDAISIEVGTYNENGLNVDKNSIHIWAQRGTTLIDVVTGTQTLLVSGNNCTILNLAIAQAGQIGLNITGSGCLYQEGAVVASTVSVDINGNGCIIERVFCAGYSTAGIDISSAGNLLLDVSVAGVGAATRGVYLSGAGADLNTIRNVYSVGNATASFELISTAQNNTIKDCSSGAGDGRWVDNDTGTNVWSGNTYADEIYHLTTFDGSGGTSENLFKVTGTVEVEYIFSDVEIALSADVGNAFLEIDDGTAQDPVTNSPGPSISSLGVGSTLLKTESAATDITVLNSDQGRIQENTSFNKPKVPFTLQQKNGVDTFVRFVYSGTGTSGQIHWHCRWKPITETGFLEAV